MFNICELCVLHLSVPGFVSYRPTSSLFTDLSIEHAFKLQFALGASERLMVAKEGWSNNNVEGSPIPRRSPSSRANSVTPRESSPADIREESQGTAVPNNDVATWVISFMRTCMVVFFFYAYPTPPAQEGGGFIV